MDYTSPVRLAVIGAIGGVIAGAMMAMVQMIYGWISDTHTFWDAPMAIWAWAAGFDNFDPPADHVGAIVLGLAGHMANSMLIGVVFAFLLTHVVEAQDAITAIVVGVAYGLVIWVIMRYVILPSKAGEAELFTTDLVSPPCVWWLSHAVLGLTAGLYCDVVGRAVGTDRRRALTRAG